MCVVCVCVCGCTGWVWHCIEGVLRRGVWHCIGWVWHCIEGVYTKARGVASHRGGCGTVIY